MGTGIVERLAADDGRRLIAALAEFRLLAGLDAAAAQLAQAGELLDVGTGQAFITQDAPETDVFFIVSGSVDVLVNGKVVNTRRAGTTSAKWQPSNRRNCGRQLLLHASRP